MDKVSDQEDDYRANLRKNPNPNDFDSYLPWACTQLSVEANIVITRRQLTEYVNTATKTKIKRKTKAPSISESISDTSSDQSATSLMGFITDSPIYLETIYDSSLNLVQLKFLKNTPIPRMVMKIIGLIIPFHKSLDSITINSGLEAEAIYEISKFLPNSRVTDICLDNTFLVEANYHLLLDNTVLRHLSVAKCKINDAVVQIIASKLVYPNPASKSLSLLNLSTNRITDLGAQHLAYALRSNRQLSYLNLADNMISDKGALSILNTLVEFPLTVQELKSKRIRRMIYLKEKKELILKTMKDVRIGDFDRKVSRRKPKPMAPLQKKSKIIENTGDSKSLQCVETLYYDKAETIVEGIMGAFVDPFSPQNTEMKNNIMHCTGNNTLSYLNIAYNNLTYISVKKLHEVLLTQKQIFKKPKPRGMVNVVIEGNLLPNDCMELQEIDDLIEAGLANYTRTSTHVKKKAYSSGNNASK